MGAPLSAGSPGASRAGSRAPTSNGWPSARLWGRPSRSTARASPRRRGLSAQGRGKARRAIWRVVVDRAQKQLLTQSLRQDLADTVCVVVTHQTGLSVDEVTQLRRQMRSAGARYRVTKNRLVRRALEGTPFAELAPLFTGPTAIAFSQDPVAAAKAAVEYANRNSKLTIIGGGLSGPLLDPAGRRALAVPPPLH